MIECRLVARDPVINSYVLCHMSQACERVLDYGREKVSQLHGEVAVNTVVARRRFR